MLPGILRSVGAVPLAKDVGCTVLHPRGGHAPVEQCQIDARAPNKAVTVVLEPYIACQSARRCVLTNDTQVFVYVFNP